MVNDLGGWIDVQNIDITILPTLRLISETLISSYTPCPVMSFLKCSFAFVSLTGLRVDKMRLST